jgi:hypothetical protein
MFIASGVQAGPNESLVDADASAVWMMELEPM